MKSEISTHQISMFLKENPFVKSVTIKRKDKVVSFPVITPEKKKFFNQLIDVCTVKYPSNTDCFMITGHEYICVCKREQDIYICETINQISISQVKMEFETLIDNQQKQGKISKFFSSFFDR